MRRRSSDVAKAPGGRLGLEGIQLPDAEAWAGGRRGPSMAVPSPVCALSRKDCVLRGRGLRCGAVARGPRVGCEAAALGSQTVHSRGGIGLTGQSPDLGTMEGGGAGVIPETCSKGSPSTRCTVGTGRPAWELARSPSLWHVRGTGRQDAALSGAPGERTARGREGASCRSLRSGVQGHLWPHTGLGWGRQRRATHSLRQCWLWRKQRPAAPRLQIPALRRNRGRAPGGLEFPRLSPALGSVQLDQRPPLPPPRRGSNVVVCKESGKWGPRSEQLCPRSETPAAKPHGEMTC